MAAPTTSEATVDAVEGEKNQEQIVATAATLGDGSEENDESVTEGKAPNNVPTTGTKDEATEIGKSTTHLEASDEVKEPVNPAPPSPVKVGVASATADKPNRPALTANMLPAKRPAPPQPIVPPEVKRIKPAVVPPSKRTATASPTASTTPKTPTLAEKRKELEATRKRRETVRERRAQLAQKLEPYKLKMEEEMRRVNEELEGETRVMNEEIRQYKEDLALLTEFKKADKSN